MNAITDFDKGSGTLVCQAGCILEVLDQYVAERGYVMPLDLGAKGSCHIGGNVATNAGGLRLLRYGNLHGSVLGLEVVLADGTIMNGLSTLRKDNTGYDLKQLFIGSEGTLGVITGVSIQTPQRPKAVNVALLGLTSFEKVQEAFQRTREAMGEILSAFEFWDQASFELTQQHLDVRQPLADAYPFYVLVESSGSDKEHDDVKMARLLESLMEQDIVVDGALAQDATQAQAMWSIREGIPEACSKSGAVLKYDISMPVPVLYKLVEDMRHRLKDQGLFEGETSLVRSVIGYGHMGDGNLHLNISAQSYAREVVDAVEPFVYEWTQKHRGSVSAEHGLGLMKANCIGYSKSPEMIETMRKIKHLFDPKGIMNPYKFLPSNETAR
jgi:FAD/FMN-containing dehydrogenase